VPVDARLIERGLHIRDSDKLVEASRPGYSNPNRIAPTDRFFVRRGAHCAPWSTLDYVIRIIYYPRGFLFYAKDVLIGSESPF
jgi:hypothetical protein